MGRKPKSRQQQPAQDAVRAPPTPFDRLTQTQMPSSTSSSSPAPAATADSTQSASSGISNAPVTTTGATTTSTNLVAAGTNSTESPQVEASIKKLEEMQTEIDKVKEQFVEERKKLAEKYLADLEPYLQKRRDIVLGKGDSENGTGIPGFWLKTLQQHSDVEEFIEEWDEDVLQYLEDIEWSHLPDMNGFKLSFFFQSNPYFTNEVLTKEVPIQNMYDPAFASPDALNIVGCKINWKPGKDVTRAPASKKRRGKGKKGGDSGAGKQRESFFRFFDNISLENLEEMDPEEAEELQFRLQSDLDIAMAIKDQIIPGAVKCYKGEMADPDYEEEDEIDDDDEEDDEAPGLEEDSSEEDDDDVRQAIAAAFGGGNTGTSQGGADALASMAQQFRSLTAGTTENSTTDTLTTQTNSQDPTNTTEQPPNCNQQ